MKKKLKEINYTFYLMNFHTGRMHRYLGSIVCFYDFRYTTKIIVKL